MKKYNVILVYNKEEDKILMCYRSKNPYKGLYNLVGGKIEDDETYLSSAYRELYEETGITKFDIKLKYLMEFSYKISNIKLQVYVGKLNKDITLIEEVNKLCWIDSNENFFDMNVYAGEGNIGHMVEYFKIIKDKMF